MVGARSSAPTPSRPAARETSPSLTVKIQPIPTDGSINKHVLLDQVNQLLRTENVRSNGAFPNRVGFAWINFDTEWEALQAQRALHGQTLFEAKISAKIKGTRSGAATPVKATSRSSDTGTVKIKPVPKHATEETLLQEIEGILSAKGSGLHALTAKVIAEREYAYVNFRNLEDATRARDILIGSTVLGTPIVVALKGDFSAAPSPSGRVMRNQAVVVTGFHDQGGPQSHMKAQLAQFRQVLEHEAKIKLQLPVLSCAVVPGPPSKAFLNFSSPPDAVRAVARIHGRELQLQGRKVTLCATIELDPVLKSSFSTEDCGSGYVSNASSAATSGLSTPFREGMFPEENTIVITGVLASVSASKIRRGIVKFADSNAAGAKAIGSVIIAGPPYTIRLHYEHPEDAIKACDGLTGKVFEGSTLSVELGSEQQETIDASPECVVVIMGPAVVGVPGLAALKLELDLNFGIKPAQILPGRRMARFSMRSPLEAAQAAQLLNGREILGCVSNVFLQSNDRPIAGGVVQWKARVDPSTALYKSTKLQQSLQQHYRIAPEAEYNHKVEINDCENYLASNEFANMYRNGLRVSVVDLDGDNDPTPYWLMGCMADGIVEVFCGNNLPTGKEGFEHQEDWFGSTSVWLKGERLSRVQAVFRQVHREKDGSVVLEYVSGVPSTQPELGRTFVHISACGDPQPLYWSSTGEPGSFQVNPRTSSIHGTFQRSPLLEWKIDSLRHRTGYGFLKSTWKWWLEGTNLGSVHEVFVVESRAGDTIDDLEIILRDNACSTRIKVSPSCAEIRRTPYSAWERITTGRWTTSMQWVSDVENIATGTRLHYETKQEWQHDGSQWWIDGNGDFSGVSNIHIETDVVGPQRADMVCMEDSSGQQTELSMSKMVRGRKETRGRWVACQPLGSWLPSGMSDAERNARKPEEEKLKQLYQQLAGYQNVMEEERKTIMSTKNAKVAKRALEKMAREVGRLQARMPAYAFRDTLLKTIQEHPVTILLGATGSGKSTQTVPFLADADFLDRKIACTQPRKVAATSLAEYVASEWGCKVGGEVGTAVGGNRKVSRETKMVYTTERVLLNELVHDKRLSKYSAVIIDEAHERNIDTDLLIGLLKPVLKARPNDFKLIIASATIDPKLFMEYFGVGEEVVIAIPGRTHPIEHVYMERPGDLARNVVNNAVNKALSVLDLANGDVGDILVFLPTPADCVAAVKQMEKAKERRQAANLVILPLHGQLDPVGQAKVFQNTLPGQRKIVFSTNAAETSVTIDGITSVIDTGLCKTSTYDAARNMNTLVTGWITKASVHQRAGRAGRTRPGIAYHMYDEEDVADMPEQAPAEILRTEILGAILRLKEIGILSPADFDFLEHPGRQQIRQGEKLLLRLGLLNESGNLTRNGHLCCKMGVSPRIAQMIFTAIDLDCVADVLPVAGILCAPGSLFFRANVDRFKSAGNNEASAKRLAATAEANAKSLRHESGDAMTAWQAYKQWSEIKDKTNQRLFCKEHLLNSKVLKSALKFSKSMALLLRKLVPSLQPQYTGYISPDLLNRCFASAYFDGFCVANGPARAGLLLAAEIDPSSLRNEIAEDEDSSFDSAAKRRREQQEDDCCIDDPCTICLTSLSKSGGAIKRLSCGHAFHRACVNPWLKKTPTCPNCRMDQGLNDGLTRRRLLPPEDDDDLKKPATTLNQGQARQTVFVHPSSALFTPPPSRSAGGGQKTRSTSRQQEALKWACYQTMTVTKRTYLRNVVKVDPSWPEVQRNVDTAAVESEARTEVVSIPAPTNLIGAFVGRQASALRHFEAVLDAVIVLPNRNEQSGSDLVEVQVFASRENIDIAAQAVENRFDVLQDEREERQRAYEEEKERRRLAWEAEQARRHEEYLERVERRRQRQQAYEEREARRQAYARQREENRRARFRRSRNYTYCGTP